MHAKGNYDLANNYYKKALNTLIQFNNIYNFEIGQILANQGELHFSSGSYGKALDCFSKAIKKIADSENDNSSILERINERIKGIKYILDH